MISCRGARRPSFAGIIEQMPPPFFSKKIAGVPAYKLARKKQEVELKPVKVEIKIESFGLLATARPATSAFRAAWPPAPT